MKPLIKDIIIFVLCVLLYIAGCLLLTVNSDKNNIDVVLKQEQLKYYKLQTMYTNLQLVQYTQILYEEKYISENELISLNDIIKEF